MNRTWLIHSIRYAVATMVVCGITIICTYVIRVNPTTVSLSFLLGILFIANRYGLGPSIFMSLLSTLAFNLFFLPPIGRLTISDSQNWIALIAFLTASTLASHLSQLAKLQTTYANRRRMEVERLYDFSQQILVPEKVEEMLTLIPRLICITFQNQEVSLYLSKTNSVYSFPLEENNISFANLQDVSTQMDIHINESNNEIIAPILLGMRNMGAFGVQGNPPSPETMEAVGSLLSLAIERSMAIEQLAHAEANRENERLRTALVDSVTHELRTPLTVITAAITSLRSQLIQDEKSREELLSIIDEESTKLNHLIGQIVEMAQLDTDQVHLNLQAASMKEVVEAAITHARVYLRQCPVIVHIPDDLPKVLIDTTWIEKVLINLLDNASKYSPENSPITIRVYLEDNRIVTDVVDQGPGISEQEKPLLFDKFFRGSQQKPGVRGTGMGLAIVKAIVEAHKGTVSVDNCFHGGSTFTFSLPIRQD